MERMKVVKKATKFNRSFDPEFLAARKDITPVMLKTAQGDLDAVASHLKTNEHELYLRNNDDNTLLLLAVANNHAHLAQFLIDIKSDVRHRNSAQMDALDYATMDGVRSQVAQVILQSCDFVIPEVLDGPHWTQSDMTIKALNEDKFVLAKCGIIGKTPDFTDVFSRASEYRVEWLKSLLYVVNSVKRGILLLDDEIGYLERDAMLTGTLEMPVSRRYVYRPDDRSIVKFSTALQSFYAVSMKERLLEASFNGDAMAVQGLLKANAQANTEDLFGQTVLMSASRSNNPLVVRCLLHAKARVNSVNREGFSALLLACVEGSDDTVRFLLRAKADVNMRTYKGYSILDFVKHEGHKRILNIISQERMTQERAAKK